MENQVLDELLNVIAVHRYVNLYSRHFIGKKNPQAIGKILSHIRDAQPGNYCLDSDVGAFTGCVDEEQEARVIVGMMTAELSSKQFKEPVTGAISITDALNKLNGRLDRPAIAVFHCFKDIYNEKEKDILRAIRKFLGMAESRLLGILIISDRTIDRWELFPESRLDRRHVAFFEYP